jgi:hypothetical protein
MAKPQNFIDRVQTHERNWGNNTYNGRPTLNDILTASVVIFWEHKDKKIAETITLHADLKDVERYFLRLMFTKQGLEGDRRISDVYQAQKRMIVRGIKIQFGEAGDESH